MPASRDSQLVKQWLDDPVVRESYEIPPDSGYWLFIKEDATLFEIYQLVTYSKGQQKARCIDQAFTLEEAREIARAQGERHLERRAKRRAGPPTPNQLAFLFQQKIPISLDLTFGRASALIDEEIARLKQE